MNRPTIRILINGIAIKWMQYTSKSACQLITLNVCYLWKFYADVVESKMQIQRKANGIIKWSVAISWAIEICFEVFANRDNE